MYAPAAQSPQDETVNCSERQLALVGFGPGTVNIVQNPGDLGRREIRIEAQTRFVLHDLLCTLRFQGLAEWRSTSILPDNCIVYAASAFAVPDQCRFTLIADADAADVGSLRAGRRHRLPRNGLHRGPDFLRIVLDPARSRIVLRKFLLRTRHDARFMIIDHSAAAAGSLVDCEQIFACHDDSFSTPSSLILRK